MLDNPECTSVLTINVWLCSLTPSVTDYIFYPTIVRFTFSQLHKIFVPFIQHLTIIFQKLWWMLVAFCKPFVLDTLAEIITLLPS